MNIDREEVFNFDNAIFWMRNSYQSWSEGDSGYCPFYYHCSGDACSVCPTDSQDDCMDTGYTIGMKDLKLALNLIRAGESHSTFMDHIIVSFGVKAPLYWWKEMDRYTVGRQRPLSTSTMHTLKKWPLVQDDFSCPIPDYTLQRLNTLQDQASAGDKQAEKQLFAELPSAFMQYRGMAMNYTTLRRIYQQRRGHKLEEWKDFLAWIETLPYSKLITEGLENEG